jgi:hypothetical protein
MLGRRSDNDVVIDESTVSRRHALIMDTPSGYVIHDLNTTNGTRVNRSKVSHGQRPLKHGDRIRLAGSEVIFIFRQDGSDTQLLPLEDDDTGPITGKAHAVDPREAAVPEPGLGKLDAALMRHMESNKGTVVSRGDIARHVLTEIPEGRESNRIIDESIERIRASIGDDPLDPEDLVTVGEFGFLLM